MLPLQFGHSFLSHHKILLVDDQLVNRKVLAQLCKVNDLTCIEAENGEKAVELCKTESFDLVLMDVQMPILNGIEATQQIRAFSETPIIGLTGDGMLEAREKCMTAGMNDVLSKPIGLTDFEKVLKKQIPAE